MKRSSSRRGRASGARALAGLRLLAVSFATLLCLLDALAAQDPKQVWEEIRTAKLEPARAVEIGQVELNMEMGSLKFEEGVLIPATHVGGRASEMVFIGEARFRVEPPDAIEEGQLSLFTDQTALDVPVGRVVLTVGNSDTTAWLLDREAAGSLGAEAEQEATQVYGEWVEGAERRGFGADAAILGSVFDDVDARGFFAAWMRSDELGDFYYRYDPTEQEQVTLGQFVAVEADVREERRIRRQIERGKRKGRYRQLRFEDLGDWDTWISTTLRTSAGEVSAGSTGIEPRRYTLDVTAQPKDDSLSGSARLEIRADREGKRILPLSLYSDLKVSAVNDAEDQPLPWFRSGPHLYVLLPAATRPGQIFEIRLDYAGKSLVELVKGKTYALLDTFSWYPRVGDSDRGTYDVTLRWPKRLDVLASGRVVDSGEELGMRWERRTLEVPAIAFSFEIGDYDIHTEKVGHVDLTVGFSKAGGSLDKGVKEEVMGTLREALSFFEESFGAYPMDHLTVATVPRGFSQGFLSFVTLSHHTIGLPGSVWMVLDSSYEDFDEYRRESRTETIAHELSHQWWGNTVGWHSYRDQWLSEALADFSAALFAAHKADRKSVYLARRGKGWRSSLTRRTKTGRSVESLGPVVMGSRLNSSHSSSAYTAVIYDKGSVIFTMLARLLGEEQLTKMLQILADRVEHQVIDTATFIRAIEQMSGLSLETFGQQFVYGTGIPEIYYTYEFQPQDDGTWIIRGKARQVATGNPKYELRRTPADTWFVPQRKEQDQETAGSASAFVVPFQVALAGAEDSVTKGHVHGAKTTTERGLGGKLLIRDEVSEFGVRIKQEPRDFWLDQRGEVLAQFFSERHQPKRMLRYRAVELAAAGDFQEAEAVFTRALGAPLIPEDELEDSELSKKEIERRARLQDCLIHIGLSRLHLEQERDDDARQALETAEGLLTRLEREYSRASRMEVQCHLDVRAGNYGGAYDVLSKWLRLDFPVRDGETASDAMRRNKFKTGRRWWGDGRDYALLAVSAYETGHAEVAAAAMEEAEKRGANIDELRKLIES